MNGVSDESQQTDLEKRKFYSQNYSLQLQGFLIDEEEFEITPAVTRQVSLFEVDTKENKRPMKPIGDSPNEFTQPVRFTTGLSETITFPYDAFVQIIEVDNLVSYIISVNGTNLSSTTTQFFVSTKDVVVFTVTGGVGFPKEILLGIQLD